MISLKSKREVEMMKEGGEILKRVFEAIGPMIRPGAVSREIDRTAEKIIVARRARPAFKGYRGYPATLCISINEEVVHGIPGDRSLKEGDVVSIDVGAEWQGYYADAARTWIVGEADEKTRELVQTAKDAFDAAIENFCTGNHIGDISHAIQTLVESRGFEVVRDFVGHGIGRALHEEPQVPNYGEPGRGTKIETGLVLAIEPMVTCGHYAVETLRDKWTVVTKDRMPASHYEDTVALTEMGPVNLTGE